MIERASGQWAQGYIEPCVGTACHYHVLECTPYAGTGLLCWLITCLHAWTVTGLALFTDVYVDACVRVCVRACVRACVGACESECVHGCVSACLRAWVRACVRACVSEWVSASLHFLCVWASVHVYTCMHFYFIETYNLLSLPDKQAKHGLDITLSFVKTYLCQEDCYFRWYGILLKLV